MSDYDFTGLAPRSFEHLVQALGARVLGPGLTVFGDGPDGGREATFSGRMPFPSVSEQWDGYCVLQAKFLQRPRDTGRDGQWLIGEVKKELDAYADPGTKRKRPDYYIICTNVVLGPAGGVGAKDKLAAVFGSYSDRVPLRGWAAWDYDQLRTYLDANRDIRAAYAGWVRSGDVLVEVAEHVRGLRPDFESTMSLFLAKEFLGDLFTNLTQATSSAEERIPIGRVFVDLPVTGDRLTPHAGRKNSVQFLASLVSEAREKCTAGCSRTVPAGREREWEEVVPEPGRVVLVGGPGQGKTTLGQFVCQVFRAALLRSKTNVAPEVARALTQLIAQCEAERLPLPSARRFPVRVVLNSFAAWIDAEVSQQRSASLLSYIAHLIFRRTDRVVSVDDLRRWLAAYPWVLVLDGLDEVPASSNRHAVLKAVDEFWIEVAEVQADVLVVATTRPQGYSDDFSPGLYRHAYLCPLSQSQALAYARRLVAAKHPTNQDRREAVYGRLEAASRLEQTGKLMRSPLQVTIMATLVDETGSPPQHRWGLFHEYYQAIYRRERERDIPAARLLRKYRKEIDTIHYRVALALQVAGESGGKTDPRLSTDDFARIIEHRLVEEGHDESSREALKKLIVHAAAERLVFLVGVEAGAVGFEIRSLQEFMAAEAVMDGPEAAVQARLRQIAPVQSWRNVFLFAAGRCFAEAQHLRDTIYTICRELNLDSAGHGTCAGGVLAVDLLEDGVAATQPRHLQLLAECALDVLRLPPAQVHSRLAQVYDPRCERQYSARLAAALRDPLPRSGAAWATLFEMAAGGCSWAQQLVETCWPSDLSLQQVVLECVPPKALASQRHSERVDQAVRMVPPWAFRSVNPARPGPVRIPESRRNEPVRWLDFERASLPSEARVKVVLKTGSGDASLRVYRAGAWRPSPPDVAHHAEWEPLVQGARFARAPTSGLLAEVLDAVARANPRAWRMYSIRAPWPLAACLGAARSHSELQTFAQMARDGRFGSIEEWTAAEQRWESAGIDRSDIEAACEWGCPLDASVATRGFPVSASSNLVTFQSTPYPDLGGVYDLFVKCGSDVLVREKLANWILLATRSVDEQGEWFTPDALEAVSQAGTTAGICLDVAVQLSGQGKLDDAWLDVFDRRLPGYPWERPDSRVIGEFLEANRHRMHRSSVLQIAAHLIAGDKADLRYVQVRPEVLQGAARRYAFVLVAAKGDIREPDAFAAMVAEAMRESHDFVTLMCEAITQQDRDDGSVVQFLTALMAQLDVSESRLHGELVQTLSVVREQAGSGITERAAWRALQLPEGLLPIVEAACGACS